MTSNRPSTSWKTLVPMVGLAYFACFAVALILRSVLGGGSLASYQLFFIPLAVISAVSAIAIWRKPRVGYVAAAVMSVVLMAIFFLTRDGNDVITVLSNPGRNLVQTVFYATTVPQFFSTFIFSVLGLKNRRNRSKAEESKTPLD